MYRSGKSFLINKLIGTNPNKGMEVSSEVKTCTKGIWIWNKPVYSEKENMYIFFLDTEGLSSV